MKNRFTKHNKLALAAAACTLLGMGAANAAVTITISEVGTDVVAHGVGSLNVSSLTGPPSPFNLDAGMNSLGGVVILGGEGATGRQTTIYTIPTGAGFGPGSGVLLETLDSVGDRIGINGAFGFLFVPSGYVSGSPLSGSS